MCATNTDISDQSRMAELNRLEAAQAEVEEVQGILRDNMGKVVLIM